jgi:hypothetical protein
MTSFQSRTDTDFHLALVPKSTISSTIICRSTRPNDPSPAVTSQAMFPMAGIYRISQHSSHSSSTEWSCSYLRHIMWCRLILLRGSQYQGQVGGHKRGISHTSTHFFSASVPSGGGLNPSIDQRSNGVSLMCHSKLNPLSLICGASALFVVSTHHVRDSGFGSCRAICSMEMRTKFVTGFAEM